MTQKIIKIGTSNAVVIPKHYMKEYSLKTGDSISLAFNDKTGKFEFWPQIKKFDTETLEWTRKFIKKYRPALEALAKK